MCMDMCVWVRVNVGDGVGVDICVVCMWVGVDV